MEDGKTILSPTESHMVKTFACQQCSYVTNRKHNLDRHVLKNHPSAVNTPATTCNPTECDFCRKGFANRFNCVRHMRICKQKPETTTDKIICIAPAVFPCPTCYKTFSRATYLNNHTPYCKKVSSPLECERCHVIFANAWGLSRHKPSCEGKGQSQSCVNATCTIAPQPTASTQNIYNIFNITNNVNIHLNDFGKESLAHIDKAFIERCLRSIMGDGVPRMIEKIHFDPQVPENKNIRLRSIKRQLVEVRENDEWKVKDSNDVIDRVISNAVFPMTNCYLQGCAVTEEDEREHHGALSQRLLSISNKNPKYHKPIKKKVLPILMNAAIEENKRLLAAKLEEMKGQKQGQMQGA